MVLEDSEREIVEDALRRTCKINSVDLCGKIKEIFESTERSSIVNKLSDGQVKALDGSHTCMMLKQCKLGTFINNVIELLNSSSEPDAPDKQDGQDEVPMIDQDPKIWEPEIQKPEIEVGPPTP